ncbi:Retroviral aspartyl protease [compost metagenome]
MNLKLIDSLPFISVKVKYKHQENTLNNVLVDTGSAGTIFKAELLRNIGIYPEASDFTCAIRGIGGSEVVFFKTVDSIEIEDITLDQFEIEVGEMEYGFPIEGILGFDFMQAAGIIIDSKQLKIHSSN